MRILVTNDDGIDSDGLHELARALVDLGDVTVVAPDAEYSGAGASLGAMHLIRPEVHDAHIDGVDRAWSVSGPPGLCVIYSRLGLFGDPFDLVVAGINPGMNVGRSVYHSGTVGAALTARNGKITGIAVSQAVTGWGVEGQGADEVLIDQRWSTAATVGSSSSAFRAMAAFATASCFSFVNRGLGPGLAPAAWPFPGYHSGSASMVARNCWTACWDGTGRWRCGRRSPASRRAG